MSLIYFIQNSTGEGITKKSETYECFEIYDILKVFHSIRNVVESTADGSSDDDLRTSKSQ